MRYYKRYIKVIVEMDKTGKITPLSIIWVGEDGPKKYEIDKIHDVRKASSVVGGCGVLYDCSISGQRRKLYFERDRWFIESYYP